MNKLGEMDSRDIEIIGITGGIGAGKSVVSRILRQRGYEVYDCDSKAKLLMERSEEVKGWLSSRIGCEALDVCGKINRGKVAEVIFSDGKLRDELNGIVHGIVRDDFRHSVSASGREVIFIESAILATSFLDRECSRIWLVTAPEEMRLGRVKLRSGLGEKEIRERMESQKFEFELLDRNKVEEIENDGLHSLLNRIDKLLKKC